MEAKEMASRARWMRIIPAVFLMYTISYFDRVNIGLAIPSMSKSLALTPAQAGLAGGIFFWGYLITFLAAGGLAPRFGARKMVFFSLLGWGFFAMLSGLVQSFNQLLLVRFLLGAAEGPVWTSTSMLLAQWFLKPERARAFGLWNLCIPVGALLAGPISGTVLAHYDWRLMFVVEGLPAWVWAAVWWFAIPPSLHQASWLAPSERDRVASALEREQRSLGPIRTEHWSVVLRHPSVWLLLGGFSLINMLSYGFSLWLPTALKSVSSMRIASVGLVSALPYFAAIIGLLIITRSSDRQGERRLHAGIPMILIGLLLLVGANLGGQSVVWQMVAFTAMGFFLYMYLPLIFTFTTEILPQSVSIPAIAFIGGVGNLFGGFVGPVLVGWVNGITHNFTIAFSLLAICGIAGGCLVIAVREDRVAPVASGVPAQ